MLARRRVEPAEYTPAGLTRRHRDLAELVDYREYDGGPRGDGFEQFWLKPKLVALGYTHVRFVGGERCEEDGSYYERVCELRKPGGDIEFYMYD